MLLIERNDSRGAVPISHSQNAFACGTRAGVFSTRRCMDLNASSAAAANRHKRYEQRETESAVVHRHLLHQGSSQVDGADGASDREAGRRAPVGRMLCLAWSRAGVCRYWQNPARACGSGAADGRASAASSDSTPSEDWRSHPRTTWPSFQTLRQCLLSEAYAYAPALLPGESALLDPARHLVVELRTALMVVQPETVPSGSHPLG